MRKFGVILVTLCLVGCSSSKPVASATPTATQAPDTIWVKQPDMNFDQVNDMPSFSYVLTTATTESFGEITLYIETQKTGYPSQWCNANYSEDAMLVENKNIQGIYTHDGTEIYSVSVDKVSTPYIAGIISTVYTDTQGTKQIAYGYANTASSTASIFSHDYKTVSEASIDQFDYAFKRKDTDPFLAYKDGVLGIAGMTYTASGSMHGWSFEAYTPTNITEKMIVPIVNEQYVTTGHAMIDLDGSYLGDLSESMSYRNGSFVNDYYVVSDGTYASVVHAGGGQNVATEYQDAKYYEDGYCPVKKSGKWGYIDQNGKEVTDFIFDDVSTIYNGYAWVKYQEKYGIINIVNTLNDSKKQVNAYWCEPCDDKAIGNIHVQVSDLTIRDGAGKTNNQVGLSIEGSSYPVFETKTVDDYTWYRINANQWIASEGTWAVYEEIK